MTRFQQSQQIPGPLSATAPLAESTLAAQVKELLRLAVLGSRSDEGRYAVPSAGALYPFALTVEMRDDGEVMACDTLRIAGLDTFLAGWRPWPGTECVITVRFLPQVSHAKYGERGVLYGFQDCGHLIASLQFGLRALGLHGRVSFFPVAMEGQRRFSLFRAVPVARIVLQDGGGPTDEPHAELAGAIRARQSASAFADTPLDQPAIAALLDDAQSLAGRLARPPAATLATHLAFRGNGAGWRLDPAGPVMPAPLDPVELFCLQEFTGTAQAIVFLSARLSRAPDVFAQNVAAGQFGQCLYLAAAMSGVAACCVGGFEYAAAARWVSPGDGRYAAYAMALGHAGAPRKKVDRINRPTPRSAIIPILSETENNHA